MIKPTLITTILSLFLLVCVFAQNSEIDSLQALLKNASPQEAYEIQKELAEKFESDSKYELAMQMRNSRISSGLGGELNQLTDYHVIARLYHGLGDYKKAALLEDSVLKIAQSRNYDGLIDNALVCAIAYHIASDNYKSAKQYREIAVSRFEASKNDRYLAFVKQNWGLMLIDLKLLPEALENFEQAQSLYISLGDFENLASAYYNAGVVYDKMDSLPMAAGMYRESLKIRLNQNFTSNLAATYYGVGHINYLMGNYAAALDTLNISLKLSMKDNLSENTANVRNDMSLVYLAKGDLENARTQIDLCLSILPELQDSESIWEIYLTDYKVNSKLGEFEKALNAYELYTKQKEAIDEAEIRERYKYDTGLDELKDELAKAEQKQNLIYLIAALIIMTIGGAYFAYRHRQNKRAVIFEKQRVEKLSRLDRLKDDFLARTSHELRTPLNGIIGLSESMLDSPVVENDKSLSNNLSMIASSGKRLSSLVNDILDFSKMKNHELHVDQKSLDLTSLTDVVMNICGTLLFGKDVKLSTDFPNDLPGIYADENRMQQILLNLLGNAIKFTDKGEIKISAAVHGDMMHISITDTGIGIDEAHQKKIFESFEQVEETSERRYSGTGLGLTITKQLVELHGGEIWCESSIGKGSTFTFSIPVSTEDIEHFIQQESKILDVGTGNGNVFSDEREIETPVRIPMKSRALATDNHFNILIVDDEAVNRQVLLNFLEGEKGYAVFQASNGFEALELIKKENFDLVLLDVMMPGMSGYSVCAKIRESYLPSELPVIMITAKGQVNDLVDGFEHGSNDYLMKPVSKPELLARIKTHLNLLTINEAYGRFIPRDFIKALGKDHIIDVKLGDQVEGYVTILFSDIRKYTTLSEGMSIDDNFKFLNAYLKRMTPTVEKHKGFIYKFLGDGIMALYHESTEDAVKSAIEQQEALRIYNQERSVVGREELVVGIGMHAGPLMLGILGDETRFDPGLVSDTVNSASRVEGLTKYYGAPIIISQEVLDGIEDLDQYNFRFLAKSMVKGKTKPLMLYEILDNRMGREVELKIKTKTEFEVALVHYFNREFTEAISILKKIKDQNPNDRAVEIYLENSAKFLIQGTPKEWSGEEVMTVK